MQDKWQEKNKELYREFTFRDFKQAFVFMQTIATEAEERQHHPRWENSWNTVKIWLSTHDADGGITEKDHSLAAFIDATFRDMHQPKDEPAPVGDFKEIKLYGDGGSRGNPGPSASGYVLMGMDDAVILHNGVYLGITTNNQAEYQSLKLGLEQARKLGAREVHVYMDSLLVVNQMKGIFKVKNRDLWPIYEAIKEMVAASFKKVTFTHVPRELNKLADAEVNKALDAEAEK